MRGNGAPENGAEFFPHNAWGWAYVECTVTGATKSCITNHENSFVWGSDIAWTDWTNAGTPFGPPPGLPWTTYLTDDPYKINGTLRTCESDPQPENYSPAFCQTPPPGGATPAQSKYWFQHHIKFDNMTNLSGRAIVYASNGWTVVTRLAPAPAPAAAGTERVEVQQFLANSTPVAPKKIFRCTVDVNGFYGCLPETP